MAARSSRRSLPFTRAPIRVPRTCVRIPATVITGSDVNVRAVAELRMLRDALLPQASAPSAASRVS